MFHLAIILHSLAVLSTEKSWQYDQNTRPH